MTYNLIIKTLGLQYIMYSISSIHAVYGHGTEIKLVTYNLKLFNLTDQTKLLFIKHVGHPNTVLHNCGCIDILAHFFLILCCNFCKDVLTKCNVLLHGNLLVAVVFTCSCSIVFGCFQLTKVE